MLFRSVQMLVGLFFSEQHTTILASITALGISEKYFAESASFTCDLVFPLHAILDCTTNAFYNTVRTGFVVPC